MLLLGRCGAPKSHHLKRSAAANRSAAPLVTKRRLSPAAAPAPHRCAPEVTNCKLSPAHAAVQTQATRVTRVASDKWTASPAREEATRAATSPDADAEDALERRALAEARLARAAKPERRAASKAKRAFSDRPGLERCRIIPEDAPFVETLILTATQPLIAPSDGDDLKREAGLLRPRPDTGEGRPKQAHGARRTGPTTERFLLRDGQERPAHGARERVVSGATKKDQCGREAQGRKSSEKIREASAGGGRAEKSERKKKRLREIDDWRKESQKTGSRLGRTNGRASSLGPKKTKDKKWGFGGVKRGSKKTTDRRDKSLSDLKDATRQPRKTRSPRRGAKGAAVKVRWGVNLRLRC